MNNEDSNSKNYETALCLALLFKIVADAMPEHQHGGYHWWVNYMFCVIFAVIALKRFFKE